MGGIGNCRITGKLRAWSDLRGAGYPPSKVPAAARSTNRISMKRKRSL